MGTPFLTSCMASGSRRSTASLTRHLVGASSASLRRFYRGAALGEEMLRATAAVIALNPHGDFMRWSGNMRLFEACGVGAFQLVDDRLGVRVVPRRGHLVIYPSRSCALCAVLSGARRRAPPDAARGGRTRWRITPTIDAWRGLWS